MQSSMNLTMSSISYLSTYLMSPVVVIRSGSEQASHKHTIIYMREGTVACKMMIWWWWWWWWRWWWWWWWWWW